MIDSQSLWYYYGFRYNGGEGFVPGAMFRKFDKRQATVYVKKVSGVQLFAITITSSLSLLPIPQIKRKFTSKGTTRIAPTVKPKW